LACFSKIASTAIFGNGTKLFRGRQAEHCPDSFGKEVVESV
jgi:hypothetical protein